MRLRFLILKSIFLMLGIVLGIILFIFLVLIHELGHFIAAKKTGVKVLEFGIGLPPKVVTLRKDKSGTHYTFNALPLGGFVRLQGEDPSDLKNFRAKDAFMSASLGHKIIILLAGVFINFLFAWGVLSLLFTRGIAPLSIIPENITTTTVTSYLTPTISFLVDQGFIDNPNFVNKVVIKEVVPGSIASSLGLMSGDQIVAIDATPVNGSNFQQLLFDHIGKDLTLVVQRNSSLIKYDMTCPSSDCILGVDYQASRTSSELKVYYRFPLWKSMGIALKELHAQAVITLDRLGALGKSFFSGSTQSIQHQLSGLSGPVGAIKLGNILIDQGLRSQFLAFGAMISFALAIFNILPIPALDGGRLVGVLIQSVFFRNKVEKYTHIEGYINFVCFVLLLLLGVYIIFKDLVAARGIHIPFVG